MRVLVCGGRNYSNGTHLSIVMHAVDKAAVGGISLLIEGGARGADYMAHVWACMEGIPSQRFPADWSTHGRAAGAIRNQQMLDEGKPDLVVAFPGGKGTADMVRRAQKAGVSVQIVEPPHDR